MNDVPATLTFADRPRLRVLGRFYFRRLLRKLGWTGLPIRIVFLAGDPLDWFSLHTLYLACVNDPSFITHVVSVGFGPWLDKFSDCVDLFARLGIEYVDGTGDATLESLKPDLIVTSSPYDCYRPSHYRTMSLLRSAQLVYLPYGADFADEKGGQLSRQVFGLDTQRHAWRIFTRGHSTRTCYARHGVPAHRVISLGLPVLDRTAKGPWLDEISPEVSAASEGKFKILYTPHHSIDGGWSTFLQHGAAIRRLVDDHADCFLMVRPHPGLIDKLDTLSPSPMTSNDFRAMFSGPRVAVHEGPDYQAAFHWSDVLISDASSFLVQYAPTRKPVIYLHRAAGWGLDDSLRDDVFDGYYVAQSEAEIEAFVVQLKAGCDAKADVRVQRQSAMSVGMFSADAGYRIARYLRTELS